MILKELMKNELKLFYFSTSFRVFALSLIGIFVPIFLLQLGFHIRDVFLFLLVANIVHAVAAPLSGYLSAKFGPKHMMFISTFIYIQYYIILSRIELFPENLLIAASIFGLGRVFYFLAFNVDFCLASTKGKHGSQFGKAALFQGIAAAAGPFIGGYLLILFSFDFVFVLTAVLLTISALPLFLTKDFHKEITITIKRIMSKSMLKDAIVYIAFGIETKVGYSVWPIFAYLFVTNKLTSLGSITSLMLIAGLTATYVIGKMTDTNGRMLTRYGSILNAGMWVSTLFVNTVGRLAFFNLLYGFTSTMYYLPHQAKVFNKSEKGDMIGYLTFREIFIQLGGILLFAMLYWVVNFEFGFLLAALSSLLMLLF